MLSVTAAGRGLFTISRCPNLARAGPGRVALEEHHREKTDDQDGEDDAWSNLAVHGCARWWLTQDDERVALVFSIGCVAST